MKHFGCSLLALLTVLTVLSPAVRAEEDARAWCLMEAATGEVLDASGEHTPLPPASVTKVMTLLLIMEAVDSGQIGWETPVTASEAAAAKGGSQIYLEAGEVMSVEEMVKSIAVSSANDCACAMAELLAGSESGFVEKMNARAEALGMKDTHFVNCTGLDDSPEARDHRTSAHDIALMSRELLTKHPDIKKFTTIWMDSVRNGSFGLSNTNQLVRFYPGCTGLKTGFTSAAKYCLSASAERDGMELIAVVLGCGSSKGRFARCRELLDRGFADYALYIPQMPADAAVAVELGKAPSVRAVPEQPPQLLVRRGELAGLTAQAELLPALTAPVQAGTAVGTLTVSGAEGVRSRIPLVAAEAVERLSFSDLFGLVFAELIMAGTNSTNSTAVQQ